uniref:HIG1 domain-containing protein n=1 Tax=Parascaris univalens TaxID=6257 RepID=A0A914ZTS2_PARUN
MSLFRKAFMQVARAQEEDWKRAHLKAEKSLNVTEKYGNIPAIPADIGYQSGKTTGGAKRGGVMQHAMSNPGVILGMGLTALALLGMMRSSFVGDRIGAQKYMRYRIIAQFFTVTALVAGVTIFGATYSRKDD